MATIVNNPPADSNSNNGMGFVLGLILLLAILYLFFVYGLPAFRQAATPQVNVPGKIDVNVNQPQSK